ncbi:MAG: 50S ribosomal protein L16 [Candidatus Altiarchaeota archaeon]
MAKSIRPGRCYHWDSPAYTRVSKNPADSFITGIPGSKINRYELGNVKAKFNTCLSIVTNNNQMVRHNSLESARITATKVLTEKVGANNFKLKVRVFPHHIMRENVGAVGAGADRVSDGMRHAFGKPIGQAARAHKGQAIISVYFDKDEEKFANVKRALKNSIHKLPGDMVLVESKMVYKDE